MKDLINLSVLVFGLTGILQATPVLTLSTDLLWWPAGVTVGWGFTLSNSVDFAVVSSSNFCLGTSGVSSLCVAPTIGSYSDRIASNFTIAGPSPESPVVSQVFNLYAGTGIGSFTINAGEPVGATDVGQLVVTYDLYSVDPNSSTFDPTVDLVSAGNFLEAPASVLVAPGAPEPSSGTLMAFLGGALVLFARRKVNK